MWNNLKASIASIVRTNNNQEITGANLQGVLNTIVNSVGANATFVGIATTSTSPGTPDGPVFYIAAGKGIYPNFGNTEIEDGEIAIFLWNGTTWQYKKITVSPVIEIDDTPIKNSQNPISSGAVYQIREDLDLGLSAEIQDYPLYNYALLSTGKYGTDSDSKHSYLKVNAGEQYIFEKISGNVRYAFTTSPSYSSGGTVSCVSGTSVVQPAIGKYLLTIPEGCSFLMFNAGGTYVLRLWKYRSKLENDYEPTKESYSTVLSGDVWQHSINERKATIPGMEYPAANTTYFSVAEHSVNFSEGVIVESTSAESVVKYLLKKYNAKSVINFWGTNSISSGIIVNFGFSTIDPAIYASEHNGSLVGLEIHNQYNTYLSKNYDFDLEFPFDGWLLIRYYTTGSIWSRLGVTIYDINYCKTNIEELHNNVEEIGLKEDFTAIPDLVLSDEENNDIVRFEEGHIKTKNFNSKELESSLEEIEGNLENITVAPEALADFAIADENDNVIFSVKEGHIKTKYFDSSKTGEVFKPYKRCTRFTVEVNCVMPGGTKYETTAKGVVKPYVASYIDNAALYLPITYEAQGKPTRLVMFGKQGGSKVTSSSDPLFGSNYLNITHYLLYLGYAVLIVDGTPDSWAAELTPNHVYETTLSLDNNGNITQINGTRTVLDGYQNGNYVAVQSARRAYDYIIKNYNIDRTGVFGWGYSQGGWMIMNIAELSGIPFLAVCMKSPVVTLKGHWNSTSGWWEKDDTADLEDPTRTVKEYNGHKYVRHPHKFRYLMTKVYDIANEIATSNNWTLDETNERLVNDVDGLLEGLDYDTWKHKWAGYDPFIRYANGVQYPNSEDTLATIQSNILMNRNNRFPVKIWICSGDAVVGYKAQATLIQAMKNAGCVADIHVYSGGDHNMSPSFFYNATLGYDYRIGYFEDNGASYSLYPPTYEMALWFYQHGGLPVSFAEIPDEEPEEDPEEDTGDDN